jgi:hypothetical protein
MTWLNGIGTFASARIQGFICASALRYNSSTSFKRVVAV